jgi:N-acyl-D-amino-acid deacylase
MIDRPARGHRGYLMAQHSASGKRLLLKNGLIVDGTGAPGKNGSVLLRGGVIEKVFYGRADVKCPAVDCSGKVIAPGFIDMHSHNDWFLASKGRMEFKAPFTRQGITTMVGGNCGFSASNIKKNIRPEYLALISDNLFKAGFDTVNWRSLKEYMAACRKAGLTHNLAMLAGHGTARASIRGYDASPLRKEESAEMLKLLEQAMDEGARGVSLGLQYEPGIFAGFDELAGIARLVKKKDRILTVHARAYSALSPGYPIKPFGKPHNLIALEEMIEVARRTGVRLQISHLMFAGTKTWRSCDRALELIDRAIDEGIDVKFDTYSYSCGASVINVVMPAWFRANIPANYDDPAALRRLRLEIFGMTALLGFGYGDVQVTYGNHEDLNRFNGMFADEIAKARGTSKFRALVDVSRLSKGVARVLNHRYSDPAIIDKLMKHRACLFMTDAWVESSGFQNPAAYGCFPRFLQLSREKGVISLEECVRKMTGASAERMGLKDRGIIREKMAADITVFNYNTIRDNTTVDRTDVRPDGIEAVYINGTRVLDGGRLDEKARPGMIL